MSDAAEPAADGLPGFWKFGPKDAPVVVENAEAVMPHLPYYLGGWDFQWAGTAAEGPPDVRIIENYNGEYRVVSAGPGGADFSFDNPYDAANGLASGLISVHVARNPKMVCLNASAARIGDSLVIVIGDPFAGKSSVALHLAVLGHRFFGHDQIAVTLDQAPVGTCLGLMPKVRLPLPSDCGDAFREFVEGYSAMQGEDMAYLKLWDGEAGGFGETAPVSTLVFLDRRQSGTAELRPASRPELARKMVSTAFAPHISYAELLDGLTCVADSAGTYHLEFSSSREAAALLSGIFRDDGDRSKE
jgi:hypothetical protein